MVPNRSLAAGTFVRQFVSGIQHQGSPTVMQLHLLCLPIPGTLQNGAVPFGDMHETPGFVSHDPTKSQWPASCSVRETIRLSTNRRIVPSSSCVEGKPGVKPCSYRPSPRPVLSRPRASLTLNPSNKVTHLFASPPILTSHQTTVPPPGCGLLARNPGRRAFYLLGTPGLLAVSIVFVTKTQFFLVGL